MYSLPSFYVIGSLKTMIIMNFHNLEIGFLFLCVLVKRTMDFHINRYVDLLILLLHVKLSESLIIERTHGVLMEKSFFMLSRLFLTLVFPGCETKEPVGSKKNTITCNADGVTL